MNGFSFLDSRCLFIEIGQSSLKALDGDYGLDLPLERSDNGQLSALCRQQLILSLRGFLKKAGRHLRPRAFCGISARGVSLRRITLPRATTDEFQRLLAMQIEKEFPLPPDALAWGFCPLDSASLAGSADSQTQESIVVALKKEALEEYSALLSECDLIPIFTLAALARKSICPKSTEPFGILDIGRNQSELLSIQNGIATSVRTLPWGGEDITRALAQKLAVSREEAEKLKTREDQSSGADAEVAVAVQEVIRSEAGELALNFNGHWNGQTLFLTGRTGRLKEIAPALSRALGGVACRRIDVAPGPGRSAAILGLQKSREQHDGCLPLIHPARKARPGEKLTRPAPWKWAALAALLAFGTISVRYAEAFVRKPRLSRRLAEMQSYRETMPKIDRELSFLEFLKNSRAPYIDATAIIANSTPAGARIDSLSMNRRGDLSLRGSVRDSQQAVEFRSKLIDSGFFQSVVVEEQTPSPDRQKVIIRMIAQWKPAGAREHLRIDLSPRRPAERTDNAPAIPAGLPSPSGSPIPAGTPLPPGIQVPPGNPVPSGIPAPTGGEMPAIAPATQPAFAPAPADLNAPVIRLEPKG